MSRPVSAEPVNPPHGHHSAHVHHPAHVHHGNHPEHTHRQAGHAQGGAQPRPANVEALILAVQRQFPDAHIRITGRGRTVGRQAELMAQQRRANRRQFLGVYRSAPHITEMDQWVTAHPHATEAETVSAFEEIINRAGQRGVVVSNHLSDRARDISIPLGGPDVATDIRRFITDLGGHVIDEHDAAGGPHLHVDY